MVGGCHGASSFAEAGRDMGDCEITGWGALPGGCGPAGQGGCGAPLASSR